MKTDLPIETKLLTSLLKKGEKFSKDQEILSPGTLMRLMRRSLGMTQEQLAKRAHVPRSTISRIEGGEIRPNERTLTKIFNAMECDLAFVLIPRFKSVEALFQERARKIAEKRVQYLEGTMALEKQKPDQTWRERLIVTETEALLKSPSH